MFLLYNQAFLYRTNWFSILCNFLYVVTVITVVTTQQVAAANQVTSNTPPANRDSVRRENRNNALKVLAISGDSLVLWGSETSSPYSGVRDTKEKYTAKLNEHILQKMASKAAVPKEVLVKDEFETTQAFESRQKEYDKQYDAQVKAQASQAEQERPLIYADGFDAVLGRPVLNKVEYDADKETFNLSISAIWADYVINIKVKVPPANAKETKANIESMNPWVVFQIEGEKVIPKSIILQNKAGTASLIKRLDFTDEQENQALLIGTNTYTSIKSANEKIVSMPIIQEKTTVNSLQAKVTPQERTGALSFDKTYDINNIRKSRGDLWVLAKTYPQVNTICLYVTMMRTDKYGNPQSTKSVVVAEANELSELRKYQNESFALENVIFPMDMFDKRMCPNEAVHLSDF